MRILRSKVSQLLSVLLLLPFILNAQNCFTTGNNNSTINFPCGVSCSTVTVRVPHLKSTGDYALNSIPYAPYPFITGTSSEDFNLYLDDRFSSTIPMPFNFCFYDSIFSNIVVGSNGLVTFDYLTNGSGSCANAYHIGPPIPLDAGTPCSQGAQWYYPRASIMANYSDLDPSDSPIDRKIQWEVFGTAPCRKFVISFYRVGIFGGSCGDNFPNTFQIVLHESTGLVDVFFQQKQLCTTSSDNGRAIFGIQDWTRTKFVAGAGRNATQWTAADEGWRFTPNGGGSRYVSAELLTLSGTLVRTADTSTTTAGLLNLSFPNICPSGTSEQFIVRTTFASCGTGPNLVTEDTITINQTNSLNATALTTNATCGAPTGSISVNVPAGIGSPPYQYSLNGGPNQTSNVFNGLVAGPYTVQVQDPNGCSSTINATVSLVGTLTVQTSSTPTSCTGASNGTITVTPTVPGAYEYNINGGPWQTSNIFTGLVPGTYFVNVRDAFGCTANNIIVAVSPGQPLLATVASSPAACNGVNNGTVTVTPTTGSAPYQYSINSGPLQTSNVFTGLAPGTYLIRVLDAGGCSVSNIPAVVGSGQALAATAASTPTSCVGANNGTATITPTNGSGPYQYSIDGGPWQPSNVFNGLAAGNHLVNVMDVSGCMVNGLQVTVATGQALTAITGGTAPSCTIGLDGTLTVTPTNGTAPYQYSIDGGPFQTSNVFTGLASGNHTVNMIDGGGCTLNGINAIVPPGQPLGAAAFTTSTSCGGASNGSITLSPNNGAGPYQYTINNGPAQGSNVFTGLAAGTYSIDIVDTWGCTMNDFQVVVPTGVPLTGSASKTDVSCFGGANGSITVNLQTGIGTPPFAYSLDGVNFQASNVFNGLVAGNYTIFFRDNNGCDGTTTASVNQPTALSATNAIQAVSCNGLADGVITANASGGTGPYQYSLDGTTWQTTNTFAVPAGAYTIYTRDNNGCQVSQTNVNMTEPAVLTATALSANATCDGGNDGQIVITAVGGNNSYQYSIDGTNFQASGIFNVAPGTYNFTVRDSRNCVATQPVTVGLTNNLTLVPAADVTTCEGRPVQLQLNTNATQFQWQVQNGLSGASLASPTANPSDTTQYIVTATLGRCSVNDTIVVNVLPAPIPNAGPDGFICFGQTYTLQGSGGVQYQWSPATGLDNTGNPNPLSSAGQTITYSLMVVGANGCNSLTPDEMTLDVTPPIVIRVSPADTVGYFGDQFQLNATSVGTDYVWSPAAGLSDPNIPNPVFTVSGDAVLTVTATTQAGCKGTADVVIKVYNGPDLYVPSAFTPNGDGLNDIFRPFPVGIKELRFFRVFNKWGQLVYSTSTLGQGWDGKLNGLDQGTSVFVWMVQGVARDGKVITKKGTVTLIR